MFSFERERALSSVRGYSSETSSGSPKTTLNSLFSGMHMPNLKKDVAPVSEKAKQERMEGIEN